MNRWGARILGVILLVVFAMMFAQMYKTLVRLQQQQAPVTQTRR
jgi:preprotein translocase subunit YajC